MNNGNVHIADRGWTVSEKPLRQLKLKGASTNQKQYFKEMQAERSSCRLLQIRDFGFRINLKKPSLYYKSFDSHDIFLIRVFSICRGVTVELLNLLRLKSLYNFSHYKFNRLLHTHTLAQISGHSVSECETAERTGLHTTPRWKNENSVWLIVTSNLAYGFLRVLRWNTGPLTRPNHRRGQRGGFEMRQPLNQKIIKGT